MISPQITEPAPDAEKQPLGHPSVECPHPAEWFKPDFATTDYITGEHFIVGYCYRCRLHVTWPPPAGDLRRYYPPSYYGSGKRFNAIVEWLMDHPYDYRVRQIERHQAPGRVLDIGCGRGILLHKLQQKGWLVLGTELSEEIARYARERFGVPVITQMLEDAAFPNKEFDLVILWHVLEHLRSPGEMLGEVARILKPGGTLLVAVPNYASPEARMSRQGWFHLDVPRHLTHFTRGSLRRALEEAGLQIKGVNFFSSEYDFFSLVQSAQNKLGIPHNLLYGLLRTRSARVSWGAHSARARRARPWQVAAALLTAIPLSLISLIAAPVLAALGKGATFTLYASKPRSSE